MTEQPDTTPHTTDESPKVEDALAVNALPDDVRHAAGDDETEDVQRNDGAVVDLEAQGDAAAD